MCLLHCMGRIAVISCYNKTSIYNNRCPSDLETRGGLAWSDIYIFLTNADLIKWSHVYWEYCLSWNQLTIAQKLFLDTFSNMCHELHSIICSPCSCYEHRLTKQASNPVPVLPYHYYIACLVAICPFTKESYFVFLFKQPTTNISLYTCNWINVWTF